MLTPSLLILGGILLLLWGAESLVSGAAWIADRLGVPPLVIGLTLVAYGTSFPEFLVSLTAALQGNDDLAVGNVVGSNICNIGLILGTAAIMRPLPVDFSLLRREVPLVIGLGFVLPGLVWDNALSRLEGVILAIAGVIYTFTTVWRELRAGREEQDRMHPEEVLLRGGKDWAVNLAKVGVGAVALLFGSRFLVDGSITLARMLDVSEELIGLSIVALGTSLPELATSVVAALKGESDISVGNVLGSNIFNVLFVLGWAASIHPFDLSLDSKIWIDLGVAAAFGLALFPLMKTNGRISRLEGGFLFLGYLGYIAYLGLFRY